MMNRILAAACMLALVSTAAAGGMETQNMQSSGYIVGSKQVLKESSSKKSASNFDMDKDLTKEEQNKLLQEYNQQGISTKDGVLYYKKKPVRYFADTCRIIEKVNPSGGKTTTFKSLCTYVNAKGSVDIYTVRKETARNKADSKTFGAIQSVKKAASIEDMACSISAQSMVKMAEAGYERSGLSAIEKILPFLPQESIGKFAKEAADKGKYNELSAIAEFLSEDMVAEIVNSEYEKAGISNVRALLPHLSQESLEQLAKKTVSKGDFSALEKMAFYMDCSVLDGIVENMADKRERIEGVAPFISGEALRRVAAKLYDRDGISAVLDLLPIMSEEYIDELKERAASRNDYDAVEQIVSYVEKRNME